jgi:hypothetical protein
MKLENWFLEADVVAARQVERVNNESLLLTQGDLKLP